MSTEASLAVLPSVRVHPVATVVRPRATDAVSIQDRCSLDARPAAGPRGYGRP
jgi:hypothetical protein